jgi:probable selenium-dependent hydroxylase accessory protein YqeC
MTCGPVSELLAALGYDGESPVAFTGAGGKTTAMFRLAVELARNRRRVLVSTTTAIFHPDDENRAYDRLLIGDIDEGLRQIALPTAGVLIAADSFDATTRKLHGYSPGLFDRIAQEAVFDDILVEADGSKQLPIKAPADHEPVIPESSRLVIGVIGLDCLDRPLNEETVHRPERLIEITGSDWNRPIDETILRRLALSAEGLFKRAPDGSRRVLLLNKADTPVLMIRGERIAGDILSDQTHPCVIDRVLVCCLQGPSPIRTVRR